MNPPRLNTRSKNAQQHPGKIEQPRKRRTKAEMELDRSRLQQEKEEKE